MRAIWLAVGIACAGLVTACKDSPVKQTEENQAPKADFKPTCLALRCEFQDLSTDDGTIVNWTWSFGAEGSNKRNPIFSYATAGSYQVSLTVTDNEGKSSSVTKSANPTPPAITSLSCVDPNVAGGFVACTLTLEAEAGFTVKLNGSSCEAHGDVFRVIAPVTATLTSDGCYEQNGKSITLAGPFASGTEINAEVVAPMLKNAPRLKVEGDYPVWHLTFEDGADSDFNDMDLTLTAVPTGN
jgi:PKD repeat protein